MLNYIQSIAATLLASRAAAQDERGATATEYGLLAGFIAMVILGGVFAFGGNLNGYYSVLADAVTQF